MNSTRELLVKHHFTSKVIAIFKGASLSYNHIIIPSHAFIINMSDNSKIRKPAPQYKTDWRKPVKNTATHKYTREVILSQFKISQTPSLNQCESLNNVTTSECNHPLLTPNLLFSTQLGANVNSRPAPVKRDSKEQVPEWFTEDTNAPKEEEELNKDKPITQITLTEEELLKRQNVEKQPVQITLSTIGNIKNLPQEFQGLSFDEEFSKIDEEFEQKQKAIIEDEQVPEWDDPNDEKADIQSPASAVVCYPLALIQSQMQDGNPFANIINENSTVDDAQRVIPFPNSIPYDKVWHYKDPQDNVQGPFSTIEMFN